MSRKPWSVLAVLLLLIAPMTGMSTAVPATADPTITTTTMPDIPMTPGIALNAHGDNSLTIANTECNGTHINGTAVSLVTKSSDYSHNYVVLKDSDGWWYRGCSYQRTVGPDGATYFVQENISTWQERLVAMNGDRVLWMQTWPSSCGGEQDIDSPTLGYDGNLYIEREQGFCNGVGYYLQQLNPATGAVNYTVSLPGQIEAASLSSTSDLLPYEDGLAVVNNGSHVYYYSYAGVQNTSETFSSAGAIEEAAINMAGRVYLLTAGSHMYYRDVDSPTINEITAPDSGTWSTELAVTPGGGVAARFNVSGTPYVGYFASNGNEVFEEEVGDCEFGCGISVDNQGNLIVEYTRRLSGGFDASAQEVYVDSYSSTGASTRLFDSGTSFGTDGTNGKDVFTTGLFTSANIGDGRIYLELCHIESTQSSDGWPTTCAQSDNPEIVVIPTSSGFGYPRSALFTTLDQKENYVALGDSYSSGEGNPPFIEPTDNDGGNGCDRSASSAYPVLLAQDDSDVRLQAFTACSGATTQDVIDGMKNEPSQLSSLSPDTDVVTITVGGDDVGFASFAEECVIGTCDSSSLQYQDAMFDIATTLPGSLTTLFGDISTDAPNAQVYVVGYPWVAPTTTGSCAFLNDSERVAANDIVDGLNAALDTAVAGAGSQFHFIDPTATGSPFIGHELCTADSYFFGLNIAQHNFSFHPNPEGQAAYEALLADQL